MENDNIRKIGGTDSKNEVEIQRLIKLVQHGFYDYYEELWNLLASIVYRWMLVRNRKTNGIDREATERLANEICSRLWENINDYQPQEGASFLTWFFEFCRRRKKELLRNPHLVLGKMDDLIEWHTPSGDTQSIYFRPGGDPQPHLRQKDSILNKLIAEEDRARLLKIKEALKKALTELDPIEEYTINARFLDKLSYETISNRLEGNIDKTHYYEVICSRAVRKLKKILEEKYGIKRLPNQEI
jgi:RNA polymerase sigma factor (sigma-70 family)